MNGIILIDDANGGTTARDDGVPFSQPLSSIAWGTALNDNSVTYFYAPSGGVYNAGGYSVTSAQWTSYEIQQFNFGLSLFSNFTNLTFTQVSSRGAADLTLVNTAIIGSSSSTLGVFGPPDTSVGAGVGAFNYNGAGWDWNNPNGGLQQGGYGFITIIHEVGHGLGLAHPHDTGGTSTILPGVTRPFDSYGTSGLNQGIFTMMSYNDGWPSQLGPSSSDNYGWQGTPMALDIAVLQAIYGANTTYHTGNNTYILDHVAGLPDMMSCIWDAGGAADSISYSGIYGSQIDLRPATLALADGGGGYISYVQGSPAAAQEHFNAFTISQGVVIENASGGSGDDSITGNQFANVLTGNGGNDSLVGEGANDNLSGGGGHDTLNGGAGNDIMVGGAGNDTYVVDNAGDVVTENLNEGTDAVQSSIVYTLGANLENLTLTGSANVNGTGNGLANVLTGNSGNNLLDGGAGADTMAGGAGNDTLYGGSGTDTAVYSGNIADYTISYVAATNVFTVTDNTSGRDGIDLVSAVELFQFADTTRTSAQLQPPTATNFSAAESYTEDVPLNLIDIVVSDPDSTSITVTLILSSTAAGRLSTGTSNAVSSSYDAGTGVWSASGALADVNSLLAGLVFTPTADFNGSFSIATSVSDGVASAITGSKSFTGTAVNDAPTLATALADQTASADTAFSYTVPAGSFTDADTSDSLGYSAGLSSGSALPAWLAFDAATRTFSGTPANSNTGVLDITVTARDGASASVSDSFQLSVVIPSRVLTGTTGNDTLTGGAGNDTLNGSTGADTAMYGGAFRQYLLTGNPISTATQQGPEGTDTLTGIEKVSFLDGSLVFDPAAHIAQVERLYLATLDRLPDALGLNFHLARLDGGMALALDANDFVNSPEFQAIYGALDNAQFVEQLYQNVLNRPSDSEGLAFHTGNLAAGMTRGQVVTNFSESPESIQNNAALFNAGLWDIDETAGSVARLYLGMLGRAAEVGGLAFHVNAIKGGQLTLGQDANNFAASPEFQTKYGALDNNQFVNQLYLNVLGRAAEPGGLAYHTNNLAHGFSRGDVAVGFTESPEFQVKTIGQVDHGIAAVDAHFP
ncbi:MAG: DUF4214 domain-containing protein [Pseudomonadota bacterium]